MKAEPISTAEFKKLRAGDQFWWFRRWAGRSPEVVGPLTVIRFSMKDMGGWDEEVIEYRNPDGKEYYIWVVSITNELNGVFRIERGARSHP